MEDNDKDLSRFIGRDAHTWDEIRTILAAPLKFHTPFTTTAFRHGETEANAAGLVSGVWDTPLTDKGYNEAHVLGSLLRDNPAAGLGPDLAICSGLHRSFQTVVMVIDRIRSRDVLVPYVRDDRLNEMNLGDLEMGPRVEVQEFADGELDYAPPGGGISYRELTRRVLSFLIDLAAYSARSGDTRFLVSTHQGPLRVIRAIILGERDSVKVLGTKTRNCELVVHSWEVLRFPAFLEDL